MTNDPASGKAVLFDLDGTLLDTVPLIVDSYQYAFQTCLGRSGDLTAILAGIGTPLDAFFAQFAPDLARKMKQAYVDFNWAHIDTHVGVFLRVPEMLCQLESAGFLLGVVTSKRLASTMHSLEQFDLGRFFQTIISMEATERHKPDPEPVFEAMRRLGLDDPSRVVFVGDSLHDLHCAKNAGCHSAIVDWTVMPAKDLMAVGPDLWLKNTGQLIDFINKI